MPRNFLEKRRHPRLNLRIPMRYRKIEASIEEFKGTLIKNISEGGARMSIYEFLPLNLKLAMEIPLAFGTKTIEGICRVAWVAKAGFGEQYDAGVEFIHLNQEDKGRITKFLFNKSV